MIGCWSDFDDFKKEQSGILSICTDRGRCKWSVDQDDSNLLPFCEKKNAREYGNSNQCESALKIPSLDQDGLFIEGCEGKSDPNCNEKRCHSFLGCEYYKFVFLSFVSNKLKELRFSFHRR